MVNFYRIIVLWHITKLYFDSNLDEEFCSFKIKKVPIGIRQPRSYENSPLHPEKDGHISNNNLKDLITDHYLPTGSMQFN